MSFSQYFCSKGCCDYYRDSEISYREINAKDKTITVIGNDCGSTAIFFFKNGAKEVIGYEKDPNLNKISAEVCQYFGVCDKLRLHGEWRGDEYPKTDVFIMDCEGCEDMLDLSKLDNYEQVCVAVHYWAKRKSELIRYFLDSGYHVTYVTPDMNEVVFCKS